MSLIDLKKGNASTAKKKEFTIDEFISDADDYAKGAPKIVNKGAAYNAEKESAVKQVISDAKRYVRLSEIDHKEKKVVKTGVRHKTDRPFRRATFTLSEVAIEQLHELSQGSDLAKSHILRILIDELCNKEQNEQLKKLLQSKVD